MLIKCDRHTSDDIAIWSEREAADMAYPSRTIADLEMRAIDTVRQFATRGDCYVSLSGGKDSSVLCAIVAAAGVDLPCYHLDTQPLSDPYVAHVLNELEEMYGVDIRVVTNHCRHDSSGWHASGTFEHGMRETARLACTHRYICGVRADESSIRSLSAGVHGLMTERSCRPLLRWTTEQVYAYAAQRGVPLHPTYAMTGGGRWTRERLRVSFLGLTHGRGIGREQWEREYYGDCLRRLET